MTYGHIDQKVNICLYNRYILRWINDDNEIESLKQWQRYE